MSVSLDGFFEGPDRQIDWHMVDDELHRHFNEWLRTMSAFLSGRVTYELMAGFWPTADSDQASTAPMVEFAGIWRDMPKIVFSRTMQRADWNTTIVRDVVVDEIQALKARPGGDMVVGGADLAATFVRHDLPPLPANPDVAATSAWPTGGGAVLDRCAAVVAADRGRKGRSGT